MGKDVSSDAQIRSRQRVRDLAEVYTHEREVNAMLDLVADMFPAEDDPENTDRTFLEPACGSGNFLVGILRRKLAFVTEARYGRGEPVEDRMLRCLSSIYGIDICAENVEESKQRMMAVIDEHVARELADADVSPAFTSAVEAILATNVVCADTLAEAAEIELIEYTPQGHGRFIREWTRPLVPDSGELSLFFTDPPRDARPVHYSELGRQEGPVADDLTERQAA